MRMEIYSDGTRKTGHEDQLEYAQIEGRAGVNDEGDAVFDRCQSGECSVKFVERESCEWNYGLTPSLDACI